MISLLNVHPHDSSSACLMCSKNKGQSIWHMNHSACSGGFHSHLWLPTCSFIDWQELAWDHHSFTKRSKALQGPVALMPTKTLSATSLQRWRPRILQGKEHEKHEINVALPLGFYSVFSYRSGALPIPQHHRNPSTPNTEKDQPPLLPPPLLQRQ